MIALKCYCPFLEEKANDFIGLFIILYLRSVFKLDSEFCARRKAQLHDKILYTSYILKSTFYLNNMYVQSVVL